MRRSLAPFSGPKSLVHAQSLADFITTTSGFRFSVHTGGLADRDPFAATPTSGKTESVEIVSDHSDV